MILKQRVSKSSAELNDSEQTDNLNLGDEIKNVLANLNANQVIETKPDEHDKNTSTSIASTTNPNSQNNDSTSSSDKNQN